MKLLYPIVRVGAVFEKSFKPFHALEYNTSCFACDNLSDKWHFIEISGKIIMNMEKNNHKGIAVTFIFLCFILAVGLCSCGSKSADNSETQIAIQDEVEALDVEQDVNPEAELVVEQESEQEVEEEVEPPAVLYTSVLEPDKSFVFRDQQVYYDIKKCRDYEIVGEDLDYKIIVDDNTREVILQYEETDSDEDWHNNYLFFPWPLKLDNKTVWTTYGYAKIYKSAQSIPLNQWMEQLEKHPDYKAVIWGWSLGSAMAKITARHYVIRTGGEFMIDELMTFGDVKCWFNPFYSVKKYCKRIREYCNSSDLITWCMPFCRRDVKCKVGPKFSLKRAKQSEYNHTHYEEYDYTKWQ